MTIDTAKWRALGRVMIHAYHRDKHATGDALVQLCDELDKARADVSHLESLADARRDQRAWLQKDQERLERKLEQARADVKKLRHVLRPPGSFELESDRLAEQRQVLAETDREEYR